MGYIREAQSLLKSSFSDPLLITLPAGIGQPLGLWRDVAEDDSIPRGNGLPNLEVKKGDRIFADFNRAHMNVCFCLPYVIVVTHTFLGHGFP
jgi:hypothetical protein